MDSLEELKADALADLEDIRNGKADLVDSTGNVIAERSTGSHTVLDSNMKDYQPFFDGDSDTDWKFDDDMLNALSDKR